MCFLVVVRYSARLLIRLSVARPSEFFLVWSDTLISGFIGTAQVHSEDVRKAGHARYTAAFLYQLLMRRTFAAHITATLPSGEVVSRIGEEITSEP